MKLFDLGPVSTMDARRSRSTSAPGFRPQTRQELGRWITEHLQLTPRLEDDLLTAIDEVLARQERLWQESKHDAVRALSAGFADRISRLNDELVARDATLSSISRYFEQLVAELTERAQRDPKTHLMNFGHFVDRLESFLAMEQRVRWCAVGLVDITGFKWYNDTFGHALGDRIIARVATVLREQVRTDDLLAQEQGVGRPADLHARLGGDEFCFLIPDLADDDQARLVASRFRDAVARVDWTTEDPRLGSRPVRVDVGVVCLWLGPLAERRPIARRLASALLHEADQLMYRAKKDASGEIHVARVHVHHGDLALLGDGDPIG